MKLLKIRSEAKEKCEEMLRENEENLRNRRVYGHDALLFLTYKKF